MRETVLAICCGIVGAAVGVFCVRYFHTNFLTLLTISFVTGFTLSFVIRLFSSDPKGKDQS